MQPSPSVTPSFVGSGGLASVLSHGTPGEISTRPMSQLPLAFIPAYFVPIPFTLHLAALFQRRFRHFAGHGHI